MWNLEYLTATRIRCQFCSVTVRLSKSAAFAVPLLLDFASGDFGIPKPETVKN